MDEHKKRVRESIQRWLKMLMDNELDNLFVLLYISPNSMISNDWKHLVEYLAQRNHICFFCIDTAPKVE